MLTFLLRAIIYRSGWSFKIVTEKLLARLFFVGAEHWEAYRYGCVSSRLRLESDLTSSLGELLMGFT